MREIPWGRDLYVLTAYVVFNLDLHPMFAPAAYSSLLLISVSTVIEAARIYLGSSRVRRLRGGVFS